MRFLDKVCVVTGSGGGIGFAIARRFAREGAHVVILDLNGESVSRSVRELADEGLKAEGFTLSVTDGNAIRQCISALEKKGSIDIWINNAGIYPQKELCEMTEAEWDSLMAINLKSVWMCTKEAAAAMKRQKRGVIIQAASFASLIGSAGSGGYAASKAAVLSLTKSFAAELAPWNIRVCAYIPGVIQTGMTKGVIESNRDKLVDGIALRKLGTPEDVAGVAAFLASEDASYLTGMAIEVTGGKLCVQNPGFSWALHHEEV